MKRKRFSKRYLGYGVVTDNLMEILKKVSKPVASYVGDKMASFVSKKLRTPKSKQLPQPSRKEILSNLNQINEEQFGLGLQIL